MSEAVHMEYSIEGGNFTRAGYASSEIKKTLKRLGIDQTVIKRTVVAAYEAEVNIVAHAYTGKVVFDIDEEKISLLFTDRGPGIMDINKAMEEGFSTASHAVREMGFGAGMGLPNIRKNADTLDVTSTVGKGTQVTITIYLRGEDF